MKFLRYKFLNKKYGEKNNIKSPRKCSKMSDKGRKVIKKIIKERLKI